MVGSLNKEISQSKDIVEVIKNSLLSPSGAGSLAEITLENILKSSHLRIGVDFIMQYNINAENENVALRPDSVVFLPGDKLMVIDAKASKFLVEEHDNLKDLARTMNTHLKKLASKNYADAVKNNLKNKSQDVVSIVTLMFLPTEQAVEKLMEADSEFMNKAWKVNIFPVGPAGLMNMLSFAKFQISEQMMIKNHLQIIEEVKKLINSVSAMTEHGAKLGNSISNVVTNYDKFAASFNRNFLSKAHKLNRMGIESSLKKDQQSLKRLQVFMSKSDMIEIGPEEKSEEKTEDITKNELIK
jgi:DNA recombination protein RmuC